MAKKNSDEIVDDIPVEVVEVPEVVEPAPKRRTRGKAKAGPVPEAVEPEKVPEVVEEVVYPQNVIECVLRGECRRKDDLPTLVKYFPHGSMRASYFLVDVGEPTLRTAWERYCETVSKGDPDEFLSMVHAILGDTRLYSGVSLLDL